MSKSLPKSEGAGNGQTCRACGSTVDLVTEVVYLGGHGYIAVTTCRWLPGCWTRQDAQYEARKAVAA